MKLRTRIIAGFLMVILVPQLLFAAVLFAYGRNQSGAPVQTGNASSYEISISGKDLNEHKVNMPGRDLFLTTTLILIFTSLIVGIWIYGSISIPLLKLKKATQNIKEGTPITSEMDLQLILENKLPKETKKEETKKNN